MRTADAAGALSVVASIITVLFTLVVLCATYECLSALRTTGEASKQVDSATGRAAPSACP